MAQAPGRNFRKGLSIVELMDMFPTEDASRQWFEGIIWPDGRRCPYCGSRHTCEASHRKMPYWCSDCRSYFSAKKGTVMHGSPLPFRKWVMAIYLHMTSLKGVSSMKLHRDINVTQKTAWFMLQRIRETFRRDDDDDGPMSGPVEVDETFVGGREANKHESRKLKKGRGGVGKSVVIAIKDRETWEIRAKVIPDQRSETLRGFVHSNTGPDATVYTDEHSGYVGIDREHETVCHSVGEFVREMAHVNGVESFWAALKRAHKGVYHKFSKKQLHRYVDDFAGRHNVRDRDTVDQIRTVVSNMVGRRLTYRRLTADYGLPSGARAF